MKPVQHWKCQSCKGYNDILNMSCIFCRVDKPNWIPTLYQIGVEFERDIFFHYGVLGYGLHTLLTVNKGDKVTKEEELFAEFYNKERILVKDMDLVQLREHRDLLASIALEAKARCSATDEELRERKAKTSKKEWLTTDQPVSDLINVPEMRKKRMSKMDKLKSELQKIGMDDSIVKEMTRNLEAKATDSKLKTVTFKKPTKEISAVTVKAEPDGKPKKPFNPASLGFRCRICGRKPCECDKLAPVIK